MTEALGIVWTVHAPTTEQMPKIIGDILARNAQAIQSRDASTELDRLQYWEGQVDALEFVLSRLTAREDTNA